MSLVERIKRSAARKRPVGAIWASGSEGQAARSLFSVSRHPQFFDRSSTGFPQGDKLVPLVIASRCGRSFSPLFSLPAVAAAQTPASRVLFRVFLSDGRVLASYGEWARVEDRVIFSIPTRLTSDPVELHLVNIPSGRVDWPRTEQYAESVRAVAYAETRGEADFARFSTEMAKALNDVARIADPGVRLATAERARQTLAEWPASHYGYRIGEVRAGAGRARRDHLAAARGRRPDAVRPVAERAAGRAAAAAAAAADRCRAGRAVGGRGLARRFAGRARHAAAVGAAPARSRGRPVAGRVGPPRAAHRERRPRTRAPDRARLHRAAAAHARDRRQAVDARASASEFEKLRDQVHGGGRAGWAASGAGEVAALLATIDLQADGALQTRDARKDWEKRERRLPAVPPLDERRLQRRSSERDRQPRSGPDA